MIKALAPMLGSFHGKGASWEGLELVSSLQSQEVLNDLAYAFALDIRNAENESPFVRAFLVATSDERHRLQLQFIDGREHNLGLHLIRSESSAHDAEGRSFVFEATRANGSVCRLTLEVLSAERLGLKFESSNSRDTVLHELWSIDCQRAAA